MRVNWNLDGRAFTASHEGYDITLTLGAAFGNPFWAITKNGEVVDTCYQHKPTNSELSARVQCEKALVKILSE